jgi:hypothetical protein
MNQKIDGFTQAADSIRNVCTFTLAGSEKLLYLQLECAEEFITRNNKQMRAALEQIGALQEPAQWPDAMHKGIEEANAMIRDALVSTIDYQTKSFKLTQKIAADLQKVLSEAISEQVATTQPMDTFGKRRAIFLRQSAAA